MSTILVVDDDQTNCKLIEHLFRKEGVEVVAAHNCEDGLALARELIPDVILMDIYLPGKLNGWDATEIIKNDESLKHIPVIAVSAVPTAYAEKTASDAGCDRFVRKPFDVAALRDHIRQYLKGPAAAV